MEPVKKTSKYGENLEKIGLSPEQSLIYQALLEKGILPARKISLFSGVGRAMTYKALEQLIELGLVKRHETKGTVAQFEPENPRSIEKILENKENQIQQAQNALGGILGGMVSDFNLLSGKPNVQFFEGISGLEKLYGMINQEKKDILLIRSPLDDDFPEIQSLVIAQVVKQAQRGIHTRAITPFQESTKKTFLEDDAKNLVERRIIEPNTLNLPSQIIIFGNYVAITSFGNTLVTTIISDELVAKTMNSLFEYVWKTSETTHNQYIEKIKSS